MGKRGKKDPENFGQEGNVLCPDYPRCSGCTEFDTCDGCNAPVCVYEVGGDWGEKDDGDLLCKRCREEWVALVGYKEEEQ